MKCPHCLESFHDDWEEHFLTRASDGQIWSVQQCTCPACEKIIIQLGDGPYGSAKRNWKTVHPKSISRAPVPIEVNDDVLVSIYSQACQVLADSPSASAALSRRCLQHILREKTDIKHSALDAEIDAVISGGFLPADLASNLDYVRVIGNFAAHPIKSQSSGEIFDIEPGEAEWNLDVIEELMDYFYVRTHRIQRKKESINVKLKEAGKPELPL